MLPVKKTGRQNKKILGFNHTLFLISLISQIASFFNMTLTCYFSSTRWVKSLVRLASLCSNLYDYQSHLCIRSLCCFSVYILYLIFKGFVFTF